MGSFANSLGNLYILVGDDNVSKWIEAKAFKTNDHRSVTKFPKKIFFHDLAHHELLSAIEVRIFVTRSLINQ